MPHYTDNPIKWNGTNYTVSVFLDGLAKVLMKKSVDTSSDESKN